MDGGGGGPWSSRGASASQGCGTSRLTGSELEVRNTYHCSVSVIAGFRRITSQLIVVASSFSSCSVVLRDPFLSTTGAAPSPVASSLVVR